MNRVEKYIYFVEIENPKKLSRVWEVRSKRTGETVGRIAWYGGWRKYVFSPAAYTFYDSDGLRFIGEFCDTQTAIQFGRAQALINTEPKTDSPTAS